MHVHSPAMRKARSRLPELHRLAAATQFVRPEDVAENIPCGPDLDAIVESVRPYWEAGFTDVATHINTGNVRLTSRQRSTAAVEATLEAAFLADRVEEILGVRPRVLTGEEEARAQRAVALAVGGRGCGEALDRHWRMIGHARHAGHGQGDAAMIGLQRLGKAQGQPGRLGNAGIGGGTGRNELRPGEGGAGQGGPTRAGAPGVSPRQ